MKYSHVVSCFALLALAACSSTVSDTDGSADANDAAAPRDIVDVTSPPDVQGLPMDVVNDNGQIDVAHLDVAPDRPRMDVSYPADAGISCGTMTCNMGQVCCGATAGGTITLACMDSCPDASVTISCSGPENCSGNPCCAQLSLGGGTGGPIGAVSCTATPDACLPMYDLAMRTGQTRLCHADADCAPSTQLPSCCSVARSGVTEHVCFNSAFIGFLPGSTCP